MLKLNEMVMYGTTGVCVVENIENKKIGREVKQYYVLKPVAQAASTVFVPADNEKLLGKVKPLASSDEIKELLADLPQESDIWVESDTERRIKFGEIISSGDRKQRLILLRTLINHQTELTGTGKRLHLADERALKEAQRLISDEFSIALNMNADDVVAHLKVEFSK